MNVEKYLQRFFKGSKEPSLKAINFFMHKLNHPEKSLKVIHIAGTNGKGSCTEILTNIFIECGYKVGKFISPHLIKYNERISINNINITDEDMERLILKLEPLIKEYNESADTNISLFELITTMAILYFKENKCDIVIMEVGLGGLYDCTNIVYPEISIITSIGFDHMNILGNTLEEIAFQKAGIIKPKSKTVYISQNSKIDSIIIQKCNKENNELHMIKKRDINNYSYDKELQYFDFKKYEKIKINLKGKSQIYNASICLECVDILKSIYKLPEYKVRESLKKVVHRARFEKICNKPTIIYDGGHNELAIRNFKNSVDMYYKEDKKLYIISILKSKDYKTIIDLLVQNDKNIYLFTNGNSKERYWDSNILKEEAKKKKNKDIFAIELEDAINLITKKYMDYTIFIVGSFYIYGDVIKYIKENKLH